MDKLKKYQYQKNMRITRILHCVIGNMNVGGIEMMLMELYRNIDKTRYQFDFVVHDQKENFYEKEICELGGQLYRVPFISKFPIRHCISFWRLLQRHPEYQIVHIHTTYAIMYVDAKIAKYFDRTVIVHSHNSGANKKHSFIHGLFKRKLSLIADYRLSCSHIAAEWMYLREHIESVRIWKNAIHLETFLFNETKRRVVREHENAGNRLIIGCVGRLSYQKNQALLLRVFKQLLKHREDAMLWLVGDGEDRQSLELQVKELHLQENVSFLGMKSNVADYMMAFDVFVLTSRWEGLSLVMIEAQASGLPVVIPAHTDKMVRITERVHVVDCYENISEWVDSIVKASKEMLDRNKQYNIVKKAGFDIITQTRMAEIFYDNIMINSKI